MRYRVTIEFDAEPAALPDSAPTPTEDTVSSAVEDLAAVMAVQAEDGLYTGGSPDAGPIEVGGVEMWPEYVASIENLTTTVVAL